jgi:hypothetical protein
MGLFCSLYWSLFVFLSAGFPGWSMPVKQQKIWSKPAAGSVYQKIGFCCGSIALLMYAGWNTWWLLVRQCIPPSILLELFGIPAPTTGMTRSWMCLVEGHFWQAVLWNPLTLPITLLYGASLAWLIQSVAFRKRVINLPPLMVKAWFILLPAAWCIKLLQGPAWW